MKRSIAITVASFLFVFLLGVVVFVGITVNNHSNESNDSTLKSINIHGKAFLPTIPEPTIGPIGTYYTDWARYRSCSLAPPFKPESGVINPIGNKLDYIIYAFGTFSTSDCLVKMLDPWSDENSFPALMALKKTNPDLKIIFSIGGWNFGSSKFSYMARTETCRAAFVQSSVSFLRQYGFDGLDIDWEYPNSAPSFRGDHMDAGGSPVDVVNYGILLKELRQAFVQESQQKSRVRLLLTAAVPAGSDHIANMTSNFHEQLDQMQIMAFDINGAWQQTIYSHTPIKNDPSIKGISDSSIDTAVNTYLKNGVPANKIRLGLALYGRGWTLQNANNTLPGNSGKACQSGCGQWADCGTYVCSDFKGQCTKVAGFMSYFEIKNLLASGTYTEKYDPITQSMYAYDSNGHWIAYDDINTFIMKLAYAKEKGLGGMWAWALDFDTYNTNPHYEVLTAIIDHWTTSSHLISSSPLVPRGASFTQEILCQQDGFKMCISSYSYIECDNGVAYKTTCPTGSPCSIYGGSSRTGGCVQTTISTTQSSSQTTKSVPQTTQYVSQISTTATVQTGSCATGTWGPNCQCNSNNMGRFFCSGTGWFLCNWESIPIVVNSCSSGLVCNADIGACAFPTDGGSPSVSTTGRPPSVSTTAYYPSVSTTGSSPSISTTASNSNNNPLTNRELIGYWGQSDLVHNPPLNSVDFDMYTQINIGFIHRFFPSLTCNGKSYVGMNFAGYCTTSMVGGCPDLFSCPTIGDHIRYRQSRGQRILISIGGSSGSYGVPSSAAAAREFAQQLYDMFLGGSSSYRPFGSVILDGVDIDVEAGGYSGWDQFVIALRAIMDAGTKPTNGKYYITGSPQCPYPEPIWGSASNANSILGNSASAQAIDLISVQFYPNQGGCEITNSGFQSNFGTWASWANTKGKSSAMVVVGIPSASNAAGAGYLSTSALASKLSLVSSNSKFGGVMLWNVEFAKYNPAENYDANIENMMHNM